MAVWRHGRHGRMVGKRLHRQKEYEWAPETSPRQAKLLDLIQFCEFLLNKSGRRKLFFKRVKNTNLLFLPLLHMMILWVLSNAGDREGGVEERSPWTDGTTWDATCEGSKFWRSGRAIRLYKVAMAEIMHPWDISLVVKTQKLALSLYPCSNKVIFRSDGSSSSISVGHVKNLPPIQ